MSKVRIGRIGWAVSKKAIVSISKSSVTVLNKSDVSPAKLNTHSIKGLVPVGKLSIPKWG